MDSLALTALIMESSCDEEVSVSTTDGATFAGEMSESSPGEEISVSSPKIGKKRSRKKVRPSVHPKFVGRGARDLYHEERGYIRCWMDLNPDESQRDVAARFNVGPGVIAALVKSSITAYEESIQSRHGRRPEFEEPINARLALISKLREDYEGPAKVKARLEAAGMKVSLSTVRADFKDLGITTGCKRVAK